MCSNKLLGTAINPIGKLTGGKDPVSLIGKKVGGTTGQLIAPGLALRKPEAFTKSAKASASAPARKKLNTVLSGEDNDTNVLG